jgi:hypothetical protein
MVDYDGSGAGEGAPAEPDRLAAPLPAHRNRFREIADEVGAYPAAWRTSPASSRRVAPRPVPYCGSSLHPQDARRPSFGVRAVQGGARPGARPGGVPRDAGRADGAGDRGEGDLLPHRRLARLPRLPDADPRQRRRARRRAPGGRAGRPHRRHRHASAAGRPARLRVDGEGRGGAPGRGQHHGEPEHRAVRRAAADSRLGRAHGDSRLHDARLRRGRLPRGRADRRRRAADDADIETLAARSLALCEKRPLYPGFRGYTTYVS